MSYQINDEEEDALHDQPLELFKFYAGIRRFMDYKTGIAGMGRRLSEQYFRERLSYSARPGRRASEEISQKKIRWCIECLEKIGLIEYRGNYVFKCLLASLDKSAQKIKGANRAQGGARGRAQEETSETTENKGQDNSEPSEAGREVGGYYPLEAGRTSGDQDIYINTDIGGEPKTLKQWQDFFVQKYGFSERVYLDAETIRLCNLLTTENVTEKEMAGIIQGVYETIKNKDKVIRSPSYYIEPVKSFLLAKKNPVTLDAKQAEPGNNSGVNYAASKQSNQQKRKSTAADRAIERNSPGGRNYERYARFLKRERDMGNLDGN